MGNIQVLNQGHGNTSSEYSEYGTLRNKKKAVNHRKSIAIMLKSFCIIIFYLFTSNHMKKTPIRIYFQKAPIMNEFGKEWSFYECMHG
jgi:hypothetical protein